MNQCCQFVVRSVNGEDAVKLHVRWTGRSDVALDLRRVKNHFGIFCGFQNLLVHALVARIVSTFAAGCEDYDFAAGLSRAWIKMDGSALQIKSAVDYVQSGVNGIANFGLRRVER